MAKKQRSIRKKSVALSTIIVLVALVAAFIIVTFALRSYNAFQVNERKDRILDIYSSLQLGDGYTLQTENIFGDKRVYSYDAGRTFSSERNYVHADTVSNTVIDLKTKIKAAGYTLFDEPYNGGQQHYKTPKGEYVRVSVESKSATDAFFNKYIMGEPTPTFSDTDHNAGPSNVTIKVNLDDNNE